MPVKPTKEQLETYDKLPKEYRNEYLRKIYQGERREPMKPRERGLEDRRIKKQ